MSATSDASNPFLKNMPMVAIARLTVYRGGVATETPDTTCKRAFFRIGNHRSYPPLSNQHEIMPSGSTLDKLFGFTSLEPYNPKEVIVPKP